MEGGWPTMPVTVAIEGFVVADDLADGIVLSKEPPGQRFGQHHGVGARQSGLRVAAQEGQAEHFENTGFRPKNPAHTNPILVSDSEQARQAPLESDCFLDFRYLLLQGRRKRQRHT